MSEPAARPATLSEGAPAEPTHIDPRLLEILVCPLTRATLEDTIAGARS